jgi:hypothetical protein
MGERGAMTDRHHDHYESRLSASQVWPVILGAAVFLAIGLSIIHFTDLIVGPWVMWLALFGAWAYCSYYYLRQDVISG